MHRGRGVLIHSFRGEACGQAGERSGFHSTGSPTLSADRSIRIRGLLDVIGWGVTQFERRSLVSRHRLARWLDGQSPDAHVVTWLAGLAALHRRLASPLSPDVRPDGNRPLLDGYEVALARITIGWSERQLAERSGEHRTTLRRLGQPGARANWRLGRWLDLLADGHRAMPRPQSDWRH